MAVVLGARSLASVFSVGHFIKQLPPLKKSVICTTGKVLSNQVPDSGCSEYGSLNLPLFHALDHSQKRKIHLYVNSLLQWNQKMNLTAVEEENDVLERHIEDSLAVVEPVQRYYLSHCGTAFDDLSVVDVGSGAGLPGLILAIAHPGWKITLLESMNKRCFFLEHVVSLVGLQNVQIVRDRAENVGQNDEFREQFDVAIARAVADMRVLAEYCLPLVRVGGLFVAAKGHDPHEEVMNAEKAIHLMGGSLLKTCPVESHSQYGRRTAVICRKDNRTPRKYPRTPGTPSKLPL